jgi:uncharacterized protein with beta-barrel porin domain
MALAVDVSGDLVRKCFVTLIVRASYDVITDDRRYALRADLMS